VKIVVEQPRSQFASVTGYAWRDVNGNAQRDAGEALAGMPVLIMRGPSCDPLLGTSYSGADGAFGFSSLPDGEYASSAPTRPPP
jgi:hypothetical protein